MDTKENHMMSLRILAAVLAAMLLIAAPAAAKKFNPTAADATAGTPRQAARIQAASFANLLYADSVVGACTTKRKMTKCQARTTNGYACHFRVLVEDHVGYYNAWIDRVSCSVS